MNFTDAVRELAEGRCEGIRTPNHSVVWKIIHHVGCRVVACEEGDRFHISPEAYLSDDWELVGEKPQMEEVPVTEYCTYIGNEKPCKLGEWPTLQDAQEACKRVIGSYVVELTGIYRRPIPRKVQRRDEIIPLSRTYNTVTCRSVIGAKVMDSSMKFYREWEEEAPK